MMVSNIGERKFATGIDLARSTMASLPFNRRPSFFVFRGDELTRSLCALGLFNHAIACGNGMETTVHPVFATGVEHPHLFKGTF
jgi:hypothetical protein